MLWGSTPLLMLDSSSNAQLQPSSSLCAKDWQPPSR